ncbi:arf-GAP with Rho-GAP domain, ANK repeat and PH domain-containing protein 1 [Xiphophorus hellerii]|uniref:arf-GAP with Rho-GAP domain, ANK repeat and PH domain-containing protein 1 n=1 Tax=Xiphophorus hellerii TaxID=8084 RepID=UPI0013B397EF|nr:arf-GAP with Rho-GAP domain, ANK repeat and PH domain-containing protein 1-like [Xiphophorus hellerii]XP_032432457.1 arf-GAP with Rho-GAP domain, ANK repeat and PH domain-containing protein 1-like [Xiphophorus hellerii]XP_032432458.1 arf-GAP with Rho-GAP domain, ANK repeat and PH domain-containing protein 1-like [Xiphophorus hellerii]
MALPPSPPVPKPRLHSSKSVPSVLNRNPAHELQLSFPRGRHQSTDEDALPLSSPRKSTRDNFPTLDGITDLIAANIPSLAGVATSFSASAPSAPPPIDSLTDSISTTIPGLAEAANAVAANAEAKLRPAPSTPAANSSDSPSLESIISSLSNITSLEEFVNNIPNPSAPPLSLEPHPPLNMNGGSHTDVGALSQLVKASLDPTAGVKFPSMEAAGVTAEEVQSPSPLSIKEEDPYVTVLGTWTNQEEAESESSNEEDDKGSSPVASGSEASVDKDPGSDPVTTRVSPNQSDRLKPTRPAPPPPSRKSKPVKQKIPRAATIRVSRKKGGGGGGSAPQSAVVRASWLDVWKGFRYSVLWVTLDGQLMSLRKKRTDRFSELLFHVSSITNVKPQDKRRFSVYFRKKHYDFMAHSNEVQEGWVTSLLATRGLQSPTPSELHGQVTLKDSRSRAYAAVWGHDLWIYPNKDSFQLGIASFSVPLNVATVKATGKHSFALVTPYKTFNLSVDSSKDLSLWLDSLTSTIQSAESCSQVALRLWENPYNKVCGDCGAANPEWASVNLLLVICHNCAAQHRVLGNSLSRVRSLRMDNKTWTEPLIQLFVTYGNRLANQVWAPAVPAADQLHPEATEQERAAFIQNKYSRGRYRRVHALTSSRSMMNQRLCQVVVSDDVEETMSLICSGAKVSSSDPQSPSPILLAEKASQALQIELLRLNEYTEVRPHQLQPANRKQASVPSGEEEEEEEELHGKLEADRFFFSLENDSAACDVLDLREVLSVFLKDGSALQFEMVTLNDHIICDADNSDSLQNHLVHILKVILPGGVSYAEVGGASAVSKVRMVDVGGASTQSDAWLVLWDEGVSLHPVERAGQRSLTFPLSMLSPTDMVLYEDTVTLVTAERTVSLRFEEQRSTETMFQHLKRALANQHPASEGPPAANQNPARPSQMSMTDGAVKGSVSPAIHRCVSHITTYGLKVEGLYRRCGLALKVKELVKALMTSPNSAPLEAHEQGVLDVGSSLKQIIRDQQSLVPQAELQQWQKAAVIPKERSRFKEYRRLLRQLPPDSRATLNMMFGHLYMVQVFSQDNKMSAHNLAVVLAPSMFQVMSQDMIALTREFIIHHNLLFLTPDRKDEDKAEEDDEEEQITLL